MNCQEVQTQLSDYLDLSLGPTRLVLLKEHLEACSPCREEAELLSESIRRVAVLPLLETPLGFTQRVMSQVRETETQSSFWQRLLLPLSGKMPVPATALVIVGILGIYLLQKQEPHRQLAPATEVITADANKQGSAPLTESESSAPANPPVAQPDSSLAQPSASMPSADQRLQPGRRDETRRRLANAVLPPSSSPPVPSSSAPEPSEPAIRPTP
ncbi:MAG: zf-HC2 domain-containing protein, partial [Candidatus Binatia bacterium]